MKIWTTCAAVGLVVATGLVAAPSASAETAGPTSHQPGVTRLAGADRYATATAISHDSFPGRTTDVFVVSGADWPDGLAAGAAAAKVNGMLLPVMPDDVPQVIGDEVSRLKPAHVWIIGGTSAVSDRVAAELQFNGSPATRIGGATRYETAANVAAKFFDLTSTGAYYASGASFADALAGGAAAAHRGVPLLLTAEAKPAATPVVPGDKIALGGTSVLSDAAVTALGARRVSGADRYATADAVSQDAFPNASTAYLANGLNFPDALSATPAASRDTAPILLTRPGCVTPGTATEFARLGAASRVVVGGTTAVSNAAANMVVCVPAPVVTPTPPVQPQGTVAQQNARKKGESYLSFTAFSRSGLVDQLKYEGFSPADAEWGVAHLDVDYNTQAAREGKAYLDFTSFSRSGLIQQLEYEGFTPEQATYGAAQNGL